MRLAPGARRVAAVPSLLALALLAVSRVAALVALLAVVAVLAFYRDPDRTPDGPGVLSPADGRVTVVREEGDRLRVGVFMNVTDVHVNRAPMGGTVRTVEHEPGGHWPAFSKAAERNERRRYAVGEYELVQIAGVVARRTTSYVQPGDELERGERLGHIAFGSRVDVLLPPDVGSGALRVAEGDAVRAGETVLAGR